MRQVISDEWTGLYFTKFSGLVNKWGAVDQLDEFFYRSRDVAVVTNFVGENWHSPLSFDAPAFHNGLEYRITDGLREMEKFGKLCPVTVEFAEASLCTVGAKLYNFAHFMCSCVTLQSTHGRAGSCWALTCISSYKC